MYSCSRERGGAVLGAQTDGKCTAPSLLAKKGEGRFYVRKALLLFHKKKPNEENNERVIANGCRQGYMEKGRGKKGKGKGKGNGIGK